MSDVKKVALVTGSTAGIGLSCAHSLAKRGVDVIVTGSRSASVVGEILKDFKKYGVRVDYVSADLGKISDIEHLWAEVIALHPNGIDILVNNAAIYRGGTLESCPDEQWDLLIDVNLSAPFHLMRRCLPVMKKKGWGRIVNISSISGLTSSPDFVAYSATKHGLEGLTKGVALENAAHGITCNAVCPGHVTTPMGDMLFDKLSETIGVSAEELLANFLEKDVPTKKVIMPDEVAELVEFLCLSNASSQITGASYLIDGGFIAH